MERQGSVQEDGREPAPRVPPAGGVQGAALSPLLKDSQGWKEMRALDPCTCRRQTHEHFPQPSGTPHFVFTHNQFLIKFDFSSHLFRRPVPLGHGEHKSGDRLAGGESKQSRALPSASFGKGIGLRTGFCLENCSHPPGRLASQASGIWIGPSQEPR